MATITAANAIFTLSISDLFPAPQRLQGFAADDIFDTDAIESAETLMGVDGVLSAGFVFVPVKQSISLQADSASNNLFETWWTTQQSVQDIFFASGIVILPGISKKFTMTQGALTTYAPTPGVKKLLQTRKYGITWQSVIPAVYTGG
jgi:hypothetical protein